MPLNNPKHLFRLVWDNAGIRRFLKFCITGGIATGINLGLLALFVEKAGLDKILSAVLSFAISIPASFALNEIWTFRERRGLSQTSLLVRIVKFILLGLVGWGINIAVYSLSLKVVGIYYIISEMIAIVVTVLWNFFSNSRWTWTTKPGDQA